MPAADVDLPADVRAELERLGDALRAAPEDGAAWRELGETFEANALPRQAERCYERAAALDPGDARSRYHRARLVAERGELDAAIALAAEAAQREPGYGPLHWRRGMWLFELGRLEEAQADFLRARALEPGNPAAAWGLARVALERGAPADALAALADARELAYTHHLRASALRALGRMEEAAREAERGGEPVWLDPWKAEMEQRRGGFHGALTRVKLAVQRGELAAAAEGLEALHAAEPANVNVVGMLSDVYVSMRRFEEAEALLVEARELLPGHDRIAFNLAMVHERAGDDARALAELEECLRLHPSFAQAHVRRGRILSRAGRAAEALASLEEARRLGDDGPELWRLLGAARAALGEWPAAAAAFEAALERYPDARLALAAAEAHAKSGAPEAAWRALDRARGLNPAESRLPAAEALVRELCGERP